MHEGELLREALLQARGRNSKRMSKEPRAPKCKQTRDLVRLALNDGLTQADIARMCRTQQPRVSRWKSGESLATEDEVRELKRLYGHRLRRASFKLYQREMPKEAPSFLKVEGKILLRERFAAFRKDTHSSRADTSALRITVQNQAGGAFVLAEEATRQPAPPSRGSTTPDEVDFGHRHAMWQLDSFCECDLEHLLSKVDKMAVEAQNRASDYYSFKGLVRLPFLLREALLNHGQRLPGIEEVLLKE